MSKTVLLYSPVLDGHPQVYCRVIADILLAQKAILIIVTRSIENIASKWPDLSPFEKHKKVNFISTIARFHCQNGHLKAEQLYQLQKAYHVDTTLFILPEYFKKEFIRISQGQTEKLLGRNVAIYGDTTKWYPDETRYGGKKNTSIASLRQLLGTTYRRYTQPWTIDQYFFEQIIKHQVLDIVLVKDERLANKYTHLTQWMPEIYKVFDDFQYKNEDYQEDKEYQWHIPRLTAFLKTVNPDDIVLFFGTGAWYKGYDYFLELMARTSDTIAIHAGAGIRYVKNKPFIGNPEHTKNKLIASGRLYETEKYVKSPKLIDTVFKFSRRFISTHRLTLSSGTVLQAMDYGLPVLVPDAGLIGYRVKKNNLGRTYQYGNIDDMIKQWNAFKQIPVEEYSLSIQHYMQQFSQDKLRQLFINVLL